MLQKQAELITLAQGAANNAVSSTSTPTPVPTPTSTPTAVPTPVSTPIRPDILEPQWNDKFSVAPGQVFVLHPQIQEPPGSQHFCYRSSINRTGNYPMAPAELTIHDLSCEIRWAPSSTQVDTIYEVGLEVGFWLTAGSASVYVTFYVEVTNNPPSSSSTPVATPTSIPTSTPPSDISQETLAELQRQLDEIAAVLASLQADVDALSPGCTVYHAVVSGDTLSSIAQRYYRDASRWPEIQAANGIVNPDLVFPGEVLCIPGEVIPPIPDPVRIKSVVEVGELQVFELKSEEPRLKIALPEATLSSLSAISTPLTAGELDAATTEEVLDYLAGVGEAILRSRNAGAEAALCVALVASQAGTPFAVIVCPHAAAELFAGGVQLTSALAGDPIALDRPLTLIGRNFTDDPKAIGVLNFTDEYVSWLVSSPGLKDVPTIERIHFGLDGVQLFGEEVELYRLLTDE
jgi:LysM repeat protein